MLGAGAAEAAPALEAAALAGSSGAFSGAAELDACCAAGS